MPRRRAAAERIGKGANFVEIAKELGKSEKDIDLGTVTKAGVIDQAVADAAFALKEGEVSAPIKGRFGPVLVQVLKIEPEQVRSFEQVAGRAQTGACGRARQGRDVRRLQQDRGCARGRQVAGRGCRRISSSKPAPWRRSTARGAIPTGKPIVNMPRCATVLAAAFSTDVGVENDPLQVQDGYIWFDVPASRHRANARSTR